MFNYDELDALATKAKEQLKEQGKNIEIDNSDEDIYKDILSDDNDYNDTKLDIEIDSSDIDYDKLYYISREKFQEEEVPTLNQYDELLFPGGPGKLQIDTWKKDWEGYDIYITEILNQTFIFRTINRFEYKQLITLQNVDALQREEVICQTVTLWPDNYTWKEMATTLAGIPSTYAEIIMEKSGFTKDYAIQVL